MIRYTYDGNVSGRLSVSTPPSKGAVIRPKQMLFPRRKERHGPAFVKYTFVLFSVVTPQSDGVTASGFSISRLSGMDWCALPVSICSSFSFSSCGGFLFSFCSSGGPFSLLAACTDSLRNDRYAWTVEFRNFLPDRPSNYRQTYPRTESLRKNCPIFGKAYRFKVEFWLSVIFERQSLVFFCGAAWFRWSRDRLFDQRRTIAYFGDPSVKTCRRQAPGYCTRPSVLLTVKHYCFIDIECVWFLQQQEWPRTLGFSAPPPPLSLSPAYKV